MTRPSVAVIVPVRHDAVKLATLLQRLGEADPDECLVVATAGDEDAMALCTERGVRCILSEPGRGPQQHAGALAATSEWLWFLHADARPPGDALEEIRAVATKGAVGGCFRFRFAGRKSAARRALAALINLRARIGVPYGDQGLFFRRDVYLGCGGFPEQPLFEEVTLVRRARRRGRFVHLSSTIDVSPRRWEQDGWIRRTISNRLLAIGYAMGISPRRLAHYYDSKKENRVPRQTSS